MKTLIVCVSVAHGNTRTLAEALAGELHAKVVEPEEVDAELVAAHDLVGFGSGIYYMSFHPRLHDLVRRLPAVDGKKAFVFATSGSPELPVFGFTHRLKRQLTTKGFDVVDSFTCRGLDTFGPLGLIGGLNRGHPNADELERAREFASELRARVAPRARRSRPRPKRVA
jgi:flavodoxin